MSLTALLARLRCLLGRHRFGFDLERTRRERGPLWFVCAACRAVTTR